MTRASRTQQAQSLTLTAIFEPVEGGWVQARLRELPEVITAAPSHDEAREMLADALREYLLSLADDAEPVEHGAGAVWESFDVFLSRPPVEPRAEDAPASRRAGG